MGKLNVAGIGPGAKEHMTIACYNALKESDIIVGYTGYIKLLPEEFNHIEMISTGMGSEEERCRIALEKAQQSEDKTVTLVCSGDSVVYGMAGLVYELSSEYPLVSINVIPGITAAVSGSALIGAGVGNDFAVISLSNYLTKKEDTYKRIEACAKADMVMAFYNPCSHKRPDCLKEACEFLETIIDKKRLCAVAKNIGRDDESYTLMTLEELKSADVDMFSTVFIGCSKSVNINGHFVTKRGYTV